MQNEFQDCNSEKWVVTLSSSAHGFTVEAMSRGAENIAVDVRAERKGSKILLSDGTMATLCKSAMIGGFITQVGRTNCNSSNQDSIRLKIQKVA